MPVGESAHGALFLVFAGFCENRGGVTWWEWFSLSVVCLGLPRSARVRREIKIKNINKKKYLLAIGLACGYHMGKGRAPTPHPTRSCGPLSSPSPSPWQPLQPVQALPHRLPLPTVAMRQSGQPANSWPPSRAVSVPPLSSWAAAGLTPPPTVSSSTRYLHPTPPPDNYEPL
jgi:hypothetical protein